MQSMTTLSAKTRSALMLRDVAAVKSAARHHPQESRVLKSGLESTTANDL